MPYFSEEWPTKKEVKFIKKRYLEDILKCIEIKIKYSGYIDKEKNTTKTINSIGFLTADKNTSLKEFLEDKEIVNVFVPTAPNPTSGFLLCIPREDIHPLNMSVEWAFKLIVSGGYITEELVKEKEEDKITE